MRRVLWTLFTVYLLLVAVNFVLAYGGDSERKLWFNIAAVCQTVAYMFGRAGIYAENRYRQTSLAA